MKRAILMAASAMLLPVAAQADFSYSYFELGYIGDVDQETTTQHENGDGLFGRINFLAGDLLFITGHIDEIESDNTRLDVDRFGLGLGIHNDVASTVGLFATLTYEDFESELGDDNGLGVNLGARYMVQEDFEAFGSVSYAEYDKGDALFLQIGGVWAFHRDYALVAEYNTGEFSLDSIDDELERDDVRLALRVQF